MGVAGIFSRFFSVNAVTVLAAVDAINSGGFVVSSGGAIGDGESCLFANAVNVCTASCCFGDSVYACFVHSFIIPLRSSMSSLRRVIESFFLGVFGSWRSTCVPVCLIFASSIATIWLNFCSGFRLYVLKPASFLASAVSVSDCVSIFPIHFVIRFFAPPGYSFWLFSLFNRSFRAC